MMRMYHHGVSVIFALSEMTKNKDPIEEYIEQITAKRDKHRNECIAQSFKELFGKTEEKKRDNREYY